MRIRAWWAVAGCACVILAGCIDTSTRVTVRPDGSGTIEKTVVLSRHLAEVMKNMGNQGDPASIENGMLNEEGLKAEAARMGPGVTFLSAQRITTDKGNGFRALYSFPDISRVTLDRNPGADLTMPAATKGSRGGTASPAGEFFTFAFEKGSPATLTIIAPKIEKAPVKPAAPPPSEADQEKMMATLKPLYSDLHIALSVEVQGTIVKTNAAWASGSTVTLIDMDFGKILADDANFRKLAGAQNQSIGDVMEMVKAMPGVKLDTQDRVSIRFR